MTDPRARQYAEEIGEHRRAISRMESDLEHGGLSPIERRAYQGEIAARQAKISELGARLRELDPIGANRRRAAAKRDPRGESDEFRAAREAVWYVAQQDAAAGTPIEEGYQSLVSHRLLRDDVAMIEYAKDEGATRRIYEQERRRLARDTGEPPKKGPRMPRAVRGRIVR